MRNESKNDKLDISTQESILLNFFFREMDIFSNFFAFKFDRFIAITLYLYVTKRESLTAKIEEKQRKMKFSRIDFRIVPAPQIVNKFYFHISNRNLLEIRRGRFKLLFNPGNRDF